MKQISILKIRSELEDDARPVIEQVVSQASVETLYEFVRGRMRYDMHLK